MKYPDLITPRVLAVNAHISTDIIERDIQETEAEIADYTKLQAAERDIARVHPVESERKLADFRAEARTQQIRDRREFVDFLKRLVAARTVAADAATTKEVGT